MKGVLVFCGGMKKENQDRPVVFGKKWEYKMPVFTQRIGQFVKVFYVARAKVWLPIQAPLLPHGQYSRV
jgi:hypothetical protein